MAKNRMAKNRYGAALLAAGSAAALVMTTATPATAAAPATHRVSVSSHGAQANGESHFPSISADGRFVAFESAATNLVPGGTSGAGDVYVRDLTTGTTRQVDVSSHGAKANGPSGLPAISEDGRYVAFYSEATNLVPGGTSGEGDVFVRDLQAGITQLVSVSSHGAKANDFSDFPSISADGRYVAFASFASNLVPGDTNDSSDVFVRDLKAGTTKAISVSSHGARGNGWSSGPSISADGRRVAFASEATNLVPGDTNRLEDVFVRDLTTGSTRRVDVSSRGTQSNGYSDFPAISPDGRYVAFESPATNLVPGDTNGSQDVFVRDLAAGSTRRVDVSSSGAQGNGESFYPSLSRDGRYVAFESQATNLVPGDTNKSGDAFVRDLKTATTQRISLSSPSGQANSASSFPLLSADGRFVAFESAASNLVPGDTNRTWDIFLRGPLN